MVIFYFCFEISLARKSQVTGYFYLKEVHIHKSKWYLEEPWQIAVVGTMDAFNLSFFLYKNAKKIFIFWIFLTRDDLWLKLGRFVVLTSSIDPSNSTFRFLSLWEIEFFKETNAKIIRNPPVTFFFYVFFCHVFPCNSQTLRGERVRFG